MTYEALPWLIFPPAVDLSNTVMVTTAGERDLLETNEQLEAWAAAERDRIPGAEAVSGRLADVRDLRQTVRAVLYARASDERPPERARRRLNLISSSGPISTALTRDGEVIEEIASADAYRRFEVAIARSAIELADRKRDGLQVCRAPSCGMLFLRDHPRQTWCSKACGNRARVARHAARQRRHRGEEPDPLRQPGR